MPVFSSCLHQVKGLGGVRTVFQGVKVAVEEALYCKKAGRVFLKTLRSVPVPLTTSTIRLFLLTYTVICPKPLISPSPFKHVNTDDLGLCVHVSNARC